MITRLPVFFDNLLALPMPLKVAFFLVYWGGLAYVVHRWLVPWIAGWTGQKLGHFEAEVPAQIGLAFGLLISFIAIPVWEQHSLAEESASTEAAAYRGWPSRSKTHRRRKQRACMRRSATRSGLPWRKSGRSWRICSRRG